MRRFLSIELRLSRVLAIAFLCMAIEPYFYVLLWWLGVDVGTAACVARRPW